MPHPRDRVEPSRRYRLLLLVPLLLMVALSSWAVASPVGGAPDENFHIASIWCGAGDREGLCESEPGEAGKLVPWATVGSQCFAFRSDISAGCQAEELGDDPNKLVLTEHVNATAHYYSPIYYAVMSVFASDNVPASVITVRIVNSLLFVLITTALFIALPARRRPLLVISLAVTMIPWGVFLVASVNANGWAVLAGGTLWLAMLGFFETSGWRRITLAVLAALTAVIGAGARSDMAAYAVLGMGAAVLLASRRGLGRRFWLSVILPAALAIVCFALFLSAQQIGIWQNGVAPGSGGSAQQGLGLLVHNFLALPSLWVGSLGTWPLGWNDVAIPPMVWVGTLFAASAAIFTGLVSMSWRKALVLAGTGLALAFLPLYLLQRSLTEVGGLVHPRYLLPLIMMFVGFALFPVGRRVPTASRLQIWTVAAILAIANAIALYSNIRRYTLADAPGVSLSTADSWWWESGVPQPTVVWVVGSVAFTAALALLAHALITRVRRTRIDARVSSPLPAASEG
ncbi:DUF2142 domain-containing protein [Microbacterium sp. NEAU-LLC]|uniref:DUF2142 domain-containing protein n=1 Tax=Microbacterium helvum TaxID=2773713 RepID=A0ABR8NMX1_9MICO|nr:DUF2142 domain-containing protein [Microbacterium helvum]MBD3942012.1 DUF2142 domain-containing protein [Microbacterium helvum]